ncbi:unnamed protein product, partial [marine sediment metagenome]
MILFAAAYSAAVTTVTIKPRNVIDNTNGVDVIDNKLAVTGYSYIDQIREGNIPGHEFLHVRGHSHVVGAVDQELSALSTAGFGNWPAAAAGAVLVSTSEQDVVAGTGARSIIIRGLDANWVSATATVVPTGDTPTAATSQTFIRVYEIEVVTAGSGHTNDGDITLSISGTNIIKMFEDHSTSEAGRRTVPAGKVMYLENLEGSAIGNKEVTYHVFCRNNAIADSPFLLRASWHSKDG